MTRDKSLAIVCFTGDSGLTDYSASLTREISKQVFTVLVTGGSLAEPFRAMGFDVLTLFRRSRWYPLDVLRFALWAFRSRPKVINFQAHLKVPLVEGVLVAMLRSLGMRCVLTVHDVLPHYPNPWSRFEFGWFYRRFDKLVVHSEAACQGVRALGVGAPVLVVPHGVYDIFRRNTPDRAQARARIGLDGCTDCCVLFFGHLEPRKGLLEFLQAAALCGDMPGLRFILAGKNDVSAAGGAASAALDAARSAPNMLVHDKRVPFEAVEDYFCSADVVALPYLEGTTSGVLKLALAFGLPVVATRVGDLPEQLPPGAGLLVDADERLPQALVQALQELRARQPEFAAAMAAAAARCNWADIATAYQTFMFEGLGEPLA